MVEPSGARKEARRLYFGTWAAYGLLWAGLNLLHGGHALRIGLGLLSHVVVGALSGLAVARVGQVLLRRLEHPASKAVAHGGLALLNSGVWVVCTAATWGLALTLLGHPPTGLAQLWNGAMRIQWQLLAGVLAYASVGGYTQVSMALERFNDERHRRLEAEALENRARLEALRARLDPHFLFNTLHSIQLLAERGSDRTATSLNQLSRLLRHVLRTHKGAEFLPLEDECALVRDYIALEEHRLGSRMDFHEDVDEEALDVFVPSFCIQPLVENALVHGIGTRADGGRVELIVEMIDDRVQVRVQDDGVGADFSAGITQEGIGLSVLRDRLRVLYRGDATMQIVTAPQEGFCVELSLPLCPP